MSARGNNISRGRYIVALASGTVDKIVKDKSAGGTVVNEIDGEGETRQSVGFATEETSAPNQNDEHVMDTTTLSEAPIHVFNAIENTDLQGTPNRNKKRKHNTLWKAEQTEESDTKLKLLRLENKTNSSSEVDDSDKDPDYSSDSDTDTSISITNENEHVLSEVENMNDDNKSTRTKGKKRVAITSEWKKNKVKLLRKSGKSYISLSKTRKTIAAKKLKEPCGETCRIKCFLKINEDTRKQLFEKYWDLKDVTRQRDFISKCMQQINPTYRYTKSENGRRLNHAFFFEINDQRIRVCKSFFKATLDINDRPIRTVISKQEMGFVREELRGKHKSHKKVDEEIKAGVRNHIESIPRVESHYLRQQTSREYIYGGKSLSDLFRDYKEDCKIRDVPSANLVMYSRIFNTEYNIAFFVPKKDQCDLCTSYENAQGEEKNLFAENYHQHQQEKELSRKEKQADKDKISDSYIVATYDLQAVLPVPRGNTSDFYYKSRLNSFNFTICQMQSQNTQCFFWHEVHGNRGANEIGTCVLKYLEDITNSANSDELEVTFYSDNCCGQQKNRYLFAMYLHAVAKLKIRAITHKFLIRGHTQNEGDNVHSVIEKAVKRSLNAGPIYEPSQYVSIIRSAKKTGTPYIVREMGYADFNDMKNLHDVYIGHSKATI